MKIAVIADDLTGANATGVRLSKQGFKTVTMMEGETAPLFDYYDAICIDTNSRHVSPIEAKRRVMEAASLMLDHGASLICKRIDSTVRGNIGVEITALLEALGEHATAVVIPSFPDSGRITIGGYLLVNGMPVQETDVAHDPISPITQSFVPELIAKQSGMSVESIGLDVVLDGSRAVTNRLYELIQENKRIIVVDAVTDEQIDTVAAAMAAINKTFIAVDPGPLSVAYANAKRGQSSQKGKVLVTVGSATSLTGYQLQHLIQQWGVNPIYVNPLQLTRHSEAREKEIECAVIAGLDRLQTDKVIVVTTYHPDQQLLNLAELATSEGTSEDLIAKRITCGLAEISCQIFIRSKERISACFSSGGDVTRALCAETGATGIKLNDEVFSLAAYGRFIGGVMDDIPIVTKGGLVGDVEAISTCVRFLLSRISNLSEKGVSEVETE